MDRNIEKAIAGARSKAAEDAARLGRVRGRLQEDLRSPLTKLTRGNAVRKQLDDYGKLQEKDENRVRSLTSITNLSVSSYGWVLQASLPGWENIEVQKIYHQGEPVYAVTVNGETPQDNIHEMLRNLYVDAAALISEKLREELALQRIREEIADKRKERASGTQETRQSPRQTAEEINTMDHLGYFKEMGIDPDALEGLSNEEVEALVNAAYRARARFAHPDRNPTSDDTKMRKLNNAKDILLDPKTRQDYMNRRGDFDPRRR